MKGKGSVLHFNYVPSNGLENIMMHGTLDHENRQGDKSFGMTLTLKRQ